MKSIIFACLLIPQLAFAQHGATTGGALGVKVYRDSLGIVSTQDVPGLPVLLSIDFVSGRAGALIPSGGDTAIMTYIEGGARIPSPQRVYRGSGADAGAIVLEEPMRGRRVVRDAGVRAEEVTFASGDVVLSGQIILPPGAGPFPAVVFLHGSGAATRGLFPSIGGYLAAHGIAALAYDKRGSGKSTGSWQTSTLRDLAEDARAGLQFMRRRPEIDARRVGFYGTSQGPWLATIVASQDTAVRFIVSSSGGGLGGGQQEIYRRTRMLSDSGYSVTEVEHARKSLTKYFAYLASNGKDTAGIAQIWKDHGASKWLPLVLPAENPTLAPWPASRVLFGRDLALDAQLPALHARIKAPVLMILGGNDEVFPADDAIAAMKRDLPGGARQLTSVVLPKADHGFRIKAAPGDIPVTHPDYYPTILRWLQRVL